MDPGACLDTLKHGEDITQPSHSIVQDSCRAGGIGEANAVVKERIPSTLTAGNNKDENASLQPITPVSTRGSDLLPKYSASPLTSFRTTPAAICADTQFNHYPSSADAEALSTPQDGLFDPFAPAPDMFLLAPHCPKYTQQARANVTRRLTFESSACYIENAHSGHLTDTKTNIVEEDILFQTVYRNLFEAIIWMQTKGIPSAKNSSNISVSDGCKTPPSEPRLSGVAVTCPQAPVRPSRKFRVNHKGLCRKLEF